jgi:hypothetical protein
MVYGLKAALGDSRNKERQGHCYLAQSMGLYMLAQAYGLPALHAHRAHHAHHLQYQIFTRPNTAL